ncbi:MAG: IS3 family transposase [Bacilli bacterium]|nr:IS3 family transposase [Bacilli bacterium]
MRCLSSKKNQPTKKEKALAVYELRHKYKITALLQKAKLSKSTYYYVISNLSKSDKYAEIKDVIKQIYHSNKGRYGYRRVTLELYNRGYKLNRKTVYKLMKELKIQSFVKIRKYRSYKGNFGLVAKNLLNRNFKANKPNEKWVTDITQFALLNRRFYLSPIIDLYNGEVVSYNLSERPFFKQIEDMLDKAFERIPDNSNLILHSDQGWQYQLERYQNILKNKGIIQSMSRKGNCLDNACAENFFSILKSEFFYAKEFESINQFKQELDDYIYYYNNSRIKLKLNGKSPIQYRMEYYPNVA